MKYKIIAKNIGKKFTHGYIYKGLTFEVESGEVLTIAGHNGSGKTTLVKIIAGLIYPDKGAIQIYENNTKLNFPYIGKIGLVGPYLELYDQLTAKENLKFFASQLGVDIQDKEIDKILEKIDLGDRGNDFVGGFSSGMKQRMKYAILYLKKFPIYLLDEPTSNFDDKGRELFLNFVSEHRDSIIVIASNIKSEIELGDKVVELS